MTSESTRQRQKPSIVLPKVIEAVRRSYPAPVEPKILREKLELADRTVDDNLKRGVDLGIFKKIERGSYLWVPFEEDIEDKVKQALSDLRDVFSCYYPPITYVASHPKVRMPPEKLKEVLYAIGWREPSNDEVAKFLGTEHSLRDMASYLKWTGKIGGPYAPLPEFEEKKRDGEEITMIEKPPEELVERVKRYLDLYPDRVGKSFIAL